MEKLKKTNENKEKKENIKAQNKDLKNEGTLEKAEKELETEKKIKEKKEKIFMMILLCVLIIVIALVLNYISRLDTSYTESHNFYQYFGGQKVEYTGVVKIQKRDKEITDLVSQDKKITLDSTPVYSKDTADEVIFPKAMAFVEPTVNGQMSKLTNFSKASLSGEQSYIETPKVNKPVTNSFIFDGNDLYFFLEKTTITVDGKDYELSPLSYAVVTYGQSVEFYNKQDDSYKIIETTDTAVSARTENYSINMSTDSFVSGTKEQLLLKNIDSLKPIE